MDFTEFLKKIVTELQGGKNQASFTKEVLEHMMTDEEGLHQEALHLLNGYKEPTYRAAYKGKISGIAKRISPYLEPMVFEDYIHSSLSTGSLQNLCSSFVEDIPDININNAGKKLSIVLNQILKDAASANPPSVRREPIPKSDAEKDNVVDCNEELKTYLIKSSSSYSEIKTLLNHTTPSNINDVYVCNDLRFEHNDIEDATVSKLESISKHIIIRGGAGSGKSTLMKHLFLTSIVGDENKIERIPVLLHRLHRYKSESLTDYILQAIREYASKITKDDLVKWLVDGKIILLIDGLDELKSEYSESFNSELESFSHLYSHIVIIMTSRPQDNYIQYPSFSCGDIRPFTYQQSVEYLKKQKCDNNLKKEELIGEIELYYHRELDYIDFYDATDFIQLHEKYEYFISNPLLLTILLMSYGPGGLFGQNSINFYHNIFRSLVKRLYMSQVAIKPLYSGLPFDDFYDYFALFCAYTYEKGMSELNYFDFKKFIKNNPVGGHNISTESFILDITENIGLLNRDGEQIYFIHRSFQEYFAAVHYNNLTDEDFSKLNVVFESKSKGNGDETLEMLYELAPGRVNQLIIKPYLDKVVTKSNGYIEYLKCGYKEIRLEDYRSIDFCEPNLITSLINDSLHYNKTNSTSDSIEELNILLSQIQEKKDNTIVFQKIEKELWVGENNTISYTPISSYIDQVILAPTNYVFNHMNKYPNLIQYLKSQDCEYYNEYERVCDLYDEIKNY